MRKNERLQRLHKLIYSRYLKIQVQLFGYLTLKQFFWLNDISKN